jgi:hypothetical protein
VKPSPNKIYLAFSGALKASIIVILAYTYAIVSAEALSLSKFLSFSNNSSRSKSVSKTV